MNDKDRAAFYREQATQLKDLAEVATSLEARSELMALAGNYETLAERIDRRLKSS